MLCSKPECVHNYSPHVGFVRVQLQVDPGKYALIGAAAQLGILTTVSSIILSLLYSFLPYGYYLAFCAAMRLFVMCLQLNSLLLCAVSLSLPKHL